MKNRLMAAFAVVFLASSLGGCVTWEQIIGKVKVAITEGDELVAKNKNIFIDACAAGKRAHEILRTQMDAGIIRLSAKDDANEMALYNQGVEVCATVPNDLASLFKKIPQINAWIERVAILAGKVS
jgi:hypothetical protein